MVCLPSTFENPSDAVYVVLGCVVFNVGTPMVRPSWLNATCGTYCLYEGGGAGIMPSPLLLLKPRAESEAKLPAGLSLLRCVRKTLTRHSFTAVAPKFLV